MVHTMEFYHKSVLLDECMEALAIRPDGVYADMTLGGAGHSYRIAEQLTTGHLYCVDRDADAIAAAGERLAVFRERVTIMKANFRDMAENFRDVPPLDGMLFDLGVSSYQLDEAERGFSYTHDAPLDMRMDRDAAYSAWDVVNTMPQPELAGILRDYGEERFAGLIAAAIVREREKKPITSTLELAQIIARSVPNAKKERQHPAKRSFQAVRIATNDELAALEEAMGAAVELLAPGGRIAVITFHSLEDRIVKTEFRRLSRGCTCPPDFPVCTCKKVPTLRIINGKPITPAEAELRENPRSRSAKLRVAEKTGY